MPRSVEEIETAIRKTVLERQALREQGATRDQLEKNRLGLVRLQWQLSYALIDRYLTPVDVRAAA